MGGAKNKKLSWAFFIVTAVGFIFAAFYTQNFSLEDHDATQATNTVHPRKLLVPMPNSKIPPSNIAVPLDLAAKSSKAPVTRAIASVDNTQALGTYRIDPDSHGRPFRITGSFNIEKKPNESASVALNRFLQKLAPELGIDHPEQLGPGTQKPTSLGLVTEIQQQYSGIPVDGAQVRIHQDAHGEVFMITSSYLPQVSDINLHPDVTGDEALNLAKSDALKMDPNGRPPVTDSTPSLVIHSFKTTSQADLAWQVSVSQPWLGSQGVHVYYIDAHHPDLMDRLATAKQ